MIHRYDDVGLIIFKGKIYDISLTFFFTEKKKLEYEFSQLSTK